MTASASPPSGRRWLRLGVRTSMVLILILGGGLGWMAHRARVQREAVAAILRARGMAYYGWRRVDWRFPREIKGPDEPWAPRWLVDLIGVDYFDSVTFVHFFTGNLASDAELAHVGRLDRL